MDGFSTQILTCKLKLLVDDAQRGLLLETAQRYRDALNYASQVAFREGKLAKAMKLQSLVYRDLRERFGLPSQMACNAPRQVAACYKALWTKAQNNAKHRKLGWTKKCYKGLDKPPRFTELTVTYNYKRDYSFGKGQMVSIGTLSGRVRCRYEGWNRHLELIRRAEVTFGAAKLWRDPATRQWYLLVTVEVPCPKVEARDIHTIKGVDVGIRYLAVSADSRGKSRFWKGGKIIDRADHYARVRRDLQRKGTRGAKRRMRCLALRERRFRADVNHKIAHQMACQGVMVGLEDLTGIDERTEPKRSTKASKKRRRANRHRSSWGFADLQAKIHYKSVLRGGVVVYVAADYTSQQCPQCGHTDPNNRPNQGLEFRCLACGYTLHADLVGARNVEIRTRLVRQDWARLGRLSTVPEGADGETKAKHLQRCLELRWSPAPSPTQTDLGWVG